MSIINTQAVANAKKVLTGKTAHCTMQRANCWPLWKHTRHR